MTMTATKRLRLRREAAELTANAMEVTDPAERARLLAEARSLIERLERDEAEPLSLPFDEPIAESSAGQFGLVLDRRRYRRPQGTVAT
jgi:transcriptional regulator with XRE-family HTH domain